MSAENRPLLPAADAMLAIEALIASKRAAFRRPLKISIAIAEHGTMAFDTSREHVGEQGWNTSADVAIIANERTISDLLLGTFDPAEPGEEHLFLWSGEEAAWRALIDALSGAKSMLAVRAQANGRS